MVSDRSKVRTLKVNTKENALIERLVVFAVKYYFFATEKRFGITSNVYTAKD